jgi:hypothetical protein
MSQLRQRAIRAKEQGNLERRNWNPSPDSAHYKVYRWWQRQSDKWTAQENFCHYWRVIFIWAPLRWLVKPMLWLLGVTIVAMAVLGIAKYGETALQGLLMGVALLASAAYLYLGFKVAGQLLYKLNDSEFRDYGWPWLDRKNHTIFGLMMVAFLPVSIAIAILLLTLSAIIAVLSGLHEDYDLYARINSWFVDARPGNSKWVSWIRPWLIFPAILVVSSFFSEGALVLLMILLFIAAIFGVIFLAAYVTDTRRERERAHEERLLHEARMARINLVLESLYYLLHPERQNLTSYRLWRERYDQHLRRYWDVREAYDLNIDWHLRFATKRLAKRPEIAEALRLFQEQMRELSVTPPAPEPSRFKQFWRSVGDFLALIWSEILRRKWKICPRVVLPR